MEDQDFDAMMQIDSEAPAETPPASDAPADKTTEVAPAEAPKDPAETLEDGTTPDLENPEEGALPKEVEAFKPLLDAKKWDPKSPEFIPTVLKSYQEIESRASRADTNTKNTAVRADQLSALVEGDLEGINKVRQARGLSEIQAQKPIAERKQETQNLITTLNQVLSGQDDGTAFNQLQTILTKAQRDLDVEEAMQAKTPAKSRDAAFNERKTQATAVFGSLIQENKDAQSYVDELSTYFDPGGLFYAMGIDLLDAFKTPELARGFSQLGQALHVFKNQDKVIEAKAKAEVERRRTAENGGGTGATPQRKAKPQNAGAFDLTEVF